jgi:hypothetical protein
MFGFRYAGTNSGFIMFSNTWEICSLSNSQDRRSSGKFRRSNSEKITKNMWKKKN